MDEKEEICIKCGKYPAEECFTFCEFCLGVSDKDDYIKQLKSQLDIANNKLTKIKERTNSYLGNCLSQTSIEYAREILTITDTKIKE